MKQKTVHNETHDGSWYWIVEETDGLKWWTLATGNSISENEANIEADSYLGTGAVNERISDRDFGTAIVSSFELRLMQSGVNDNLAFAEAVDELFDPISSALERGRLHIALKRIGDLLDIPSEERSFLPLTSNENMLPIYNMVADRINLPRR